MTCRSVAEARRTQSRPLAALGGVECAKRILFRREESGQSIIIGVADTMPTEDFHG